MSETCDVSLRSTRASCPRSSRSEEVIDPHAYGICVRLIREDGEDAYSATVKELPDVEVFDHTFSDAYQAAVEVIEGLAKSAGERKEPFPRPEERTPEASGRITLRMS